MRRAGILAVAALAAWARPAPAETFAAWLEGVRAEAAREGVGEEALDRAFASLSGPIERVLELDRNQIESKLTLREYLRTVVSQDRVAHGRRMAARHRTLLRRVGLEYGVQPRFILAIWGIETSYGRITGGYPVLAALATLAYDGRRRAFFRKELIAALRILDREGLDPETMLGSWAGAMGQSQFMPSSFEAYAEDVDRDGRRDIWTSEADVFASIANYLRRHGWSDDLTWGRRVLPPRGIDPGLFGLDAPRRRLPEWQALGVRRDDGSALPVRDIDASLVAPDFPEGDAFLVYENFRVTLAYNRSTYYATAVGLLSDHFQGLI